MFCAGNCQIQKTRDNIYNRNLAGPHVFYMFSHIVCTATASAELTVTTIKCHTFTSCNPQPIINSSQVNRMLNELHCMQQTILEYSETLLQLNTVCSYSNITIRYYIEYLVLQQKHLTVSTSAQGKRSLSTCTAWHSLVPLFSKENNGCYSQHAFVGFFDTKVRVQARSGLQLFQKGRGLKSLNLRPVYALSQCILIHGHVAWIELV